FASHRLALWRTEGPHPGFACGTRSCAPLRKCPSSLGRLPISASRPCEGRRFLAKSLRRSPGDWKAALMLSMKIRPPRPGLLHYRRYHRVAGLGVSARDRQIRKLGEGLERKHPAAIVGLRRLLFRDSIRMQWPALSARPLERASLDHGEVRFA